MVQKGGVIFGVSAVTCFSVGLLLWLFIIQADIPDTIGNSRLPDHVNTHSRSQYEDDDAQARSVRDETNSPKVTSYSWGNIKLENGSTYKDCKVWPGGSIDWDWATTGTHHSPGVQVEDVNDIIDSSVDVLVIGNGMQRQLGVPADTLDYVTGKNIEVLVLQTEKAIEKYNDLVEEGEKRVGGIFHSTC
ncbi:mth938 domain-containing protein-like [Ptychodera flava]|uniref:mth938 domain-containing protein-like n=1 Tax=Ptychodera flava TaxID=63121 RepID=UPI003969D43D